MMILRCRKCRHELVTDVPDTYLTSHGEAVDACSQDSDCGGEQKTSWFVTEASVPWILKEVDKSQWTKGKLNCPKCGARVGGFDFISRSKCCCGSSVLPAVHLVKSKVDHPILPNRTVPPPVGTHY